MNFNDSNIRCLILVLFLVTTPAADIKEGNFGAKRSGASSNDGARPASRKEAGKTIKSYPFTGTLHEVDPSGKFILLKGKSKNRQILLSPEIKIWRDDSKISLSELTIGHRVAGSVHKNESGQEQALTVRLREKESKDPPAKLSVK